MTNNIFINEDTGLKSGQYLSKVTNQNNLMMGYLKARKGVTWKASVQYCDYSIFENINKLSKNVSNGTYKQNKFNEFMLNERSKTRHIKAVSIIDRILQRTMCDEVLVPVLQRYLIYDNGASVKNKGLKFAQDRMTHHLHNYWINNGYSNDGYILLIDFSKYFDSIDHEILLNLVKEKIDDLEFLKLLEYLISTFDYNGDYTKSLGIGSQVSQILGIFYPAKIDNYFKIFEGIKYYGRYMDDSYIISSSKEFLQDMLDELLKLCEKFKITVNMKKTKIMKLSTGFKWLKVRYILDEDGRIYKKVNGETIKRERKKLKKQYKKFLLGEMSIEKIYNMYQSWRGNYYNFDSKQRIKEIDDLYDDLFGFETRIFLEKKMKTKKHKKSKEEMTSEMYI